MLHFQHARHVNKTLLFFKLEKFSFNTTLILWYSIWRMNCEACIKEIVIICSSFSTSCGWSLFVSCVGWHCHCQSWIQTHWLALFEKMQIKNTVKNMICFHKNLKDYNFKLHDTSYVIYKCSAAILKTYMVPNFLFFVHLLIFHSFSFLKSHLVVLIFATS